MKQGNVNLTFPFKNCFPKRIVFLSLSFPHFGITFYSVCPRQAEVVYHGPSEGLGFCGGLGLLHMLQGGGAESALDKEGLKSLPALMSYILCVKKHDAVLELPALALCILSCFLLQCC